MLYRVEECRPVNQGVFLSEIEGFDGERDKIEKLMADDKRGQ